MTAQDLFPDRPESAAIGPLAAILYHDTPPDALLAGFARRLIAQGLRVGGVVQERPATAAGCRCAEMALLALANDHRTPVAQPLGPGSTGCRLDFGALAQVAQDLLGEIDAGLDLLILNRFGKAEAEGRGFRDVIAAALAREIPVLTALHPRNLPDWTRFTEGAALLLVPDETTLHHWLDDSRGVAHAA
ncbi:DUF2478 domain-containing protein [Rhodobacter capsulatus]|uniref:DUF2478 domain-containing protein n=1 Tax=Rhodobacter capsulatus TaxID=1061 RepID=A0A1G7KUE0_RHOCA|nr:DUF2478 domain-containing protein [Rhodobacter capsulatus]WER08710.1 DUF2478 domain-containing protein [Rhodobacter capsulatus]SDF40833.1 Protein of unknown function [Rhodobacter capsulatus]